MMIQAGNSRRVAQSGERGFSKMETEESGGESRQPVASARMDNAELKIPFFVSSVKRVWVEI